MTEIGGIKQQLEELLAEPLASVRSRENSALERLLASTNGRVVLFGAGNLGRRALSCLQRIGISPLAFSDNNSRLWNSMIDGCPVVCPGDAASRFGADALFVVAIWNAGHYYGDTKRRLIERGCKHITSVSSIYWHFHSEFLPFFCQDLPHKLYQDADHVIAAAPLFSDYQSRQIYLSQIRWRALGEWDSFVRPDCEESYFPESIFSLLPNEGFVDCGAFDGDTVRSFLARQGPNFDSILAIEADALTFSKLQTFIDGLDPAIKPKISSLNVAVAAERGTIRFTASGGVDSRISETGTSNVECFALDELLQARRASYIKLDIEGAEYDALKGAVRTMRRDRPVLSVCVYHTQHDIWRLPLFIQQKAEDYMFFLREHEGDGWQTVLYAVPVERVRSSKLT